MHHRTKLSAPFSPSLRPLEREGKISSENSIYRLHPPPAFRHTSPETIAESTCPLRGANGPRCSTQRRPSMKICRTQYLLCFRYCPPPALRGRPANREDLATVIALSSRATCQDDVQDHSTRSLRGIAAAYGSYTKRVARHAFFIHGVSYSVRDYGRGHRRLFALALSAPFARRGEMQRLTRNSSMKT